MDDKVALPGLRVLDLTRGIAGPLAAMLLGDLGAEVLRIEPPEGDPLAGDPGYLCWNRNKTVAVADLTSREGLREARRLTGLADVILVDQRRSVLEAFGLDADSVHPRNPGAVHVWLPPYGEVGRWSDLPADDVLLAATSGVADLYNATEDRPVVPVVPILMYEQGALGAAAALAALVERDRTGLGRSAVVSGLHSVAAMLAAVLTDAPGAARPVKAAASLLPQYRHYRCQDGLWLFLGALTPVFFMKALEVLDLVEVMVTPGVDGEFTNLLMPGVASPVIDQLSARFDTQPRAHWLAALSSAGVPNAPVDSRDRWLDSEIVAFNGLRVALAHPRLGIVDLPGCPINLSETPCSVRSLPPDTHLRIPADSCWTEVAEPATQAEHPGIQAPLPLPLVGVRVLDLSTFVAGTFGPSVMASYGAEVAKVESLAGDPYRVFGLSFGAFNQGKQGLAIDLKQPEGLAALVEIAKEADVLVDNLRPGARARLGLDPAVLRAANPNIICCSVTGFGESGPLADTPGFDPLVQSRSGLMTAQGGSDDPVFSVMLVHDILAGTLAGLGILAAILHHRHTGLAQDVRVSLASAAMIAQSGELVRYPGRPAPVVGGRDWPGPSETHRLYQCRDGWIAVAASSAPRRDALLTAVEAVTGDAASIQAALLKLSVNDAIERLVIAGVDAAAVLSRHGIFNDPWLAENHLFHEIADPVFGACTVIRGYSSWAGSLPSAPTPSPAIGQHSSELLRRASFSTERIERLVAAGVVRVREPDR